MSRKFFLYCFLFAALISSCKVIKPISPTAATIPVPQPPQPTSDVDIPISVDLANYIRQADADIPSAISGGESPCQGLRYHYEANRSPISFTGAGNTIDLASTVSYGVGAEYCAQCVFGNCVVPKPSGSCGEGGEARRRVNIGFKSTANILPDYSLKTSTALSTLNPLDQCRVTLANIDITGKIMDIVRGNLNRVASQIDSRVSAVNVRPKMQDCWTRLLSEIKISDYGYFSINPQALRLSSLNITNTTLNFSVGMSAKPYFSSVSHPVPTSQLPNLSSYTPADGFNVSLDLISDYAQLSKMANQAVAGKKIAIKTKFFKKSIVTTKVSVYGLANQKLVVAVDFKGWRKGTIYLTGTPVYNNVSNELSCPDINFDLATKSYLLNTAKWLLNPKISDLLRDKAHYNFSSLITANKEKLQSELNRPIGANVKLSGTINYVNIQSIYPTNSYLLLRTMSNGHLKIDVN